MRGTVTIEPLADALAILAPVCEAYERHALTSNTERCWMDVGLLDLDLGRLPNARDAFGRASRTSSTPRPSALAYVALLDADPASAAAHFARALAELPPTESEPWWERFSRAELTLGWGLALRAGGRLREARSALETAVAELDAITRTNPSPRIERQLGRARRQLALVLSSLQAPPAEVAPVAAAAAAWLQRVGGSPAQLAELLKLGVH